jgi:hypothetical protein
LDPARAPARRIVRDRRLEHEHRVQTIGLRPEQTLVDKRVASCAGNGFSACDDHVDAAEATLGQIGQARTNGVADQK